MVRPTRPRPPRLRRIRKADVRVGMRVTCKWAVEAEKRRHDAPDRRFEPGTVGRVASVDCPCVTYRYRNESGGTASFVCVDFTVDGEPYRVRLYYTNVKVLP
jgi:hypothetical protein